MKLISLSYYDLSNGWGFEDVKFFDLTLFVGISGAGKTQILKGIVSLVELIRGNDVGQIKWDVKFEIDKVIYQWEGAFIGSTTDIKNKRQKSILEYEKITADKKIIVDRNSDTIVFDGKTMPKLSPEQTIIYTLKEEELLNPITTHFNYINYTDNTNLSKLRDSYIKIDDLKINDLFFSILDNDDDEAIKKITDGGDFLKLVLCYFENEKLFNSIKSSFQNVFPLVENLLFKDENENESNTIFPLDRLHLYIKQKGVDAYISQKQISSGMLRTLKFISDIYLSPKGSIMLIDEFENSLGVNCINTIVDDILYENDRIQFIATSHHPYVINKIPYEYWKIVTRKGGIIKTYDAKDFDLGDSHHEQFINLINLHEYREGIN